MNVSACPRLSVSVLQCARAVACPGTLCQWWRQLHTSPTSCGKRNFRKFLIGHHRGTARFRNLYRNQKLFRQRYPGLKLHTFGDRPLGVWENDEFVNVPEMAPELVVPDLTGFELKPYVSYRVAVPESRPFTAKDLFNQVYSEKMVDDFNSGQLDERGNSLSPSQLESMSPEQARDRVKCVVSDILEHEFTYYPV